MKIKFIFSVLLLCSVYADAQNNTTYGSGATAAGANNSTLGYFTGHALTTGANDNVFMGYYTGQLNTGSQNVIIGSTAGYSSTSGASNTVLGYKSLYNATTSSYNTASGYEAMFNTTTGGNNTAFGYNSLLGNTTGSNNTAIGFNANVSSGALTNATALGNGASVTTSNTIQLGNSSVTQIFAGTGTSATLIAGGLKITGGTLGAGKVLTSDASGVATWQTPTGGWTASGSNIYYNTAGGNVGIGNASPGVKLDVTGSSGAIIRANGSAAPGNVSMEVFNASINGVIESTIGAPSTGVRVGSRNNYNLNLFTNNVDRFTILSSNGYVGINNSTPAYQLDVVGTVSSTGLKVADGTQAPGRILTSDANGLASWQIPSGGNSQWTTSGSTIYFNSGTYVGIGTTSPAYSLDVNGTINSSSVIAANLKVTGGVPATGKILTSDANGVATWQTPAAVSSQWTTTGTSINYTTGNVGIGSSNPDAKLTVNGTVHATEVKVTATVPAPDYVFENDYKLTSLDEVKKYIDQNKHLPEVPSAKEMEKEGIKLSEMSLLLLKKVEELTLHLIELKKENEQLKSRVESIENKK